MQITAISGELLNGSFITVGRATFIEAYEKTFGSGAIGVEGVDSSPYGNVYRGLIAVSSSLSDAASGEIFGNASGRGKTIIRGPLFYWMALLNGETGATDGMLLYRFHVYGPWVR